MYCTAASQSEPCFYPSFYSFQRAMTAVRIIRRTAPGKLVTTPIEIHFSSVLCIIAKFGTHIGIATGTCSGACQSPWLPEGPIWWCIELWGRSTLMCPELPFGIDTNASEFGWTAIHFSNQNNKVLYLLSCWLVKSLLMSKIVGKTSDTSYMDMYPTILATRRLDSD